MFLKAISGREVSLLIRIILFMSVAIVVSLNAKKKKSVIEKENVDSTDFLKLSDLLKKLLTNKLHFDFVGIQTNNLNCIYFVNENNSISLEYEVLEKEQIKYVKAFKEFAKIKGFEYSLTTYGNRLKYDKTKKAPVYQIARNLTISEAVEFAKEIYAGIFDCFPKKFDVVP